MRPEAEGKQWWFWAGLLGLWSLALGLRFWGLGRFPTLVFDEVYFAIFGHNYLTQTPFFDAHPPLGKYLIALGIWLGGFNSLGYRWMNALVGSLLPLVLAGIAYQLTHRRSYALLAGLFAALDGLLLVESRYALLNVYLLGFGLLSHWFFLLALDRQGRQRWFWLTLVGLSVGGTIAVKWNGLGFPLGLYLTWFVAWVNYLLFPARRCYFQNPPRLPLQQLLKLNPLALLVYIPAIAALVYSLVWIPHLQQNPSLGFAEVQRQMLLYHQRVGSGPTVHPYCSPWFSWPWLSRPISYFYQRAASAGEPMPVIGPPLPNGATRLIYDVHALGNPPLWWLATLAIFSLGGLLLWYYWHWVTRSPQPPGFTHPESYWVPLYLVVNYAANWLPWSIIGRCTFLYHYLPAALFSWLAIAWLVDHGLRSYQRDLRILGVTLMFLILAAIVFWLPIYLGLPLSPSGFQLRILLPSWL